MAGLRPNLFAANSRGHLKSIEKITQHSKGKLFTTETLDESQHGPRKIGKHLTVIGPSTKIDKHISLPLASSTL